LKDLIFNINVHQGHLFAKIPTLLQQFVTLCRTDSYYTEYFYTKEHTLLCTLVKNAWKEPFQGWIDKSYNITCILRTAYLGYDRVSMCDVNKVADIVPTDMSVNVMIAVA